MRTFLCVSQCAFLKVGFSCSSFLSWLSIRISSSVLAEIQSGAKVEVRFRAVCTGNQGTSVKVHGALIYASGHDCTGMVS